jgi:hypothetical protein
MAMGKNFATRKKKVHGKLFSLSCVAKSAQQRMSLPCAKKAHGKY